MDKNKPEINKNLPFDIFNAVSQTIDGIALTDWNRKVFYINRAWADMHGCRPQDAIGQPLDVLAAVILGGAAITGGRGSVLGTALGVLVIQLINRTLILTGIPVEWQRLVVGIILILFISIPALRERRAKRVGHTTELAQEA